jgi:hypothetical protein
MALQSPHDALFRAAFESPRHAARLLGCLLPAELLGVVALDSLELQASEGRGRELETYRTDLLFRANVAGSPGYICFLVEHQSATDLSMPLRVLGYQARTLERYWRAQPREPLPPIIAVVISHDPKGWRGPRELVELLSESARQHAAVRRLMPNVRYIVDDLAHLSDAELRARALGAFPALVLWALRDARTPGQILRTFDHWADALTDTANAPHGRDALKQLFLYISTVAKKLTFDELTRRVAKLAPAAEEAIMTIAEQLRKEGLKQGLEQGRRQALEKLMVLKFGPLSEAVAVRIRGADAGVVERWLERILVANTAEEAVEL